MQYPSAAGYSLWLMPDTDTRSFLSPLIEQWAQYFGTPAFEPHITILGSKYFLEKTIEPIHENLSQPIQLTLNKSMHGTTEFMQVYCPFTDPSLTLLHNHFAKKHKQKPDSNYFPHMSLRYGTCSGSAYLQGLEQQQSLQNSLLGKTLIRDRVVLYDVHGPYPDRKPLSTK